MKKIQICALALLCVVSFVKAEDESINTASGIQSDTNTLSEERVGGVPSKTVTPIVLDQSDEPYMILIDETTGGRIKVWRKESGSILHRYHYYYVDYPWVVRVPEKLRMDEDPYPSIPNAPEVEGGYYLYDGVYLASAPDSALDQVQSELKRKGIVRVRGVRPIIPKKVTLSCPPIPGIQVIGFSKEDACTEYAYNACPLRGLSILVPAKDKETFEKLYKDGGFYLQKEQVLVFRDSSQEGGKSERTFTSEVVRLPDHGIVTNIVMNLIGGMYERTQYQFPRQTFVCHSDAGIAQEHQFKFVLPNEYKDFQIETIDSDGELCWGEQREPNKIRTKDVTDAGKALEYVVDAYTYATTSSKRWYRHTRYYRHSSAISVSPLVSLVNRNGNNEDFSKRVSVNETNTNGVTTIDFALKPENKKKGEGGDKQLLQRVTVTYSDGWQEVYAANQLPVGVPRIFGTLMLEYTETKDSESGNVVSGQVVLTDIIVNQHWYQRYKERLNQ